MTYTVSLVSFCLKKKKYISQIFKITQEIIQTMGNDTEDIFIINH